MTESSTPEPGGRRPTTDVGDDPTAIFLAAHGAKSLSTIVWVIFVTLAASNLQLYFVQLRSPALGTMILIVLMLAIQVMLRRNQTRAAFATLLWGLAFGGIYYGFVVAGMHTPGLLMLPLACILTSWLLPRQGWLMLGVTGIGLIAIAWQQQLGHLPSKIYDPFFWVTIYFAVCLIGTLIGMATTRSVLSQYRRAMGLANELQGLLDSATEVAIISVDMEGRISLFNPGAERMLGYRASDLVGQPAALLFPDADVEPRAAALSSALGRPVGTSPRDIIGAIVALGGSSRAGTYVCKDGHPLSVSVVTSVVRDPQGKPVGLLTIARDITAQLSAEADLRNLNAELEQRVQQRTGELTEALKNLRHTQDELIQSEKLASLGSMVAGVSHELNTPIGNAVTTATAMEDLCNSFETQVNAGNLKRAALADFIRSCRDGVQLLTRSTSRAASLIASFKQVAIDQTSERRREFSLRDVVEDVAASLRPGLKTKPLVIINEVPADIKCDGFPGPLGQVVTNLIQNAVLHAFPEGAVGTITVAAAVNGSRVEVRVSDDGQGMEAATLARIFDPFFTTKLGKGGSGLGLAICYRIATTVLAGDIKAESVPGSGSSFSVSMPLQIPGKL